MPMVVWASSAVSSWGSVASDSGHWRILQGGGGGVVEVSGSEVVVVGVGRSFVLDLVVLVDESSVDEGSMLGNDDAGPAKIQAGSLEDAIRN